jgi:hypothetical protein
LHMRLPKLKGFTNRFRTEYQVVNLDRLGDLFPDGGAVDVDALVRTGAVRKNSLVKVLGTGEITVPLKVTVHAYSSAGSAPSGTLLQSLQRQSGSLARRLSPMDCRSTTYARNLHGRRRAGEPGRCRRVDRAGTEH